MTMMMILLTIMVVAMTFMDRVPMTIMPTKRMSMMMKMIQVQRVFCPNWARSERVWLLGRMFNFQERQPPPPPLEEGEGEELGIILAWR